jgi:hypothetical protein
MIKLPALATIRQNSSPFKSLLFQDTIMNKTTEKPKGKGLLSQHPFWLGKYCLLNIIIFAIGSITIIYWDNPFKSVSFWWILSLIPLFLNRFRFIAGGSILLAAIALIYYWTEISWLYLLFLPAAIYIGHT